MKERFGFFKKLPLPHKIENFATIFKRGEKTKLLARDGNRVAYSLTQKKFKGIHELDLKYLQNFQSIHNTYDSSEVADFSFFGPSEKVTSNKARKKIP